MPDYNFWLSGAPDDARLILIEASHPAWSKTYRIVKNHADGITVQHEAGLSYFYEYVPITTQIGTSSNDLDYQITIGIGDLGETFPKEMDAIRASLMYSKVKPTVNYREYNLSDLTKPQLSILNLKITDSEDQKEGAVFICQAERMNLTKSGETYNLDDFPTLRGF